MNKELKPGMSSRFDSIPSTPGPSPAFLFSGKRTTRRLRLGEIVEKGDGVADMARSGEGAGRSARWARWEWYWRFAAAGLLAGPALAVPPLVQLPGMAGSVSETGTGGACTDGVVLVGAVSSAVSPDGRSVYLASAFAGAVAVFTRDAPTDDIDGDADVDALTDGLLKLRYLFGFRGEILLAGAVDLANCRRCVAADIEAYIQALQDL